MKPVAQLSDDEFLHLVQRAVTELPDAPLAMQQAAIGLWPQPALGAVLSSAAGLAQAIVRQLAAQLSFDSWATTALASGMRSGRSSPARHLLYTAEGRDIDLRVVPAAGSFALTGQVLGPEDQGAVDLVDAVHGAARLTTSLDELGAFRFDGVEPGRYVLTLRLGTDAIALPPLDVGALVA